MRALRDNLARDESPGPSPASRCRVAEASPAECPANDNSGDSLRLAGAFPPDATALVQPFEFGKSHGGRARRGRWQLRFEPRLAPFIDPLTGWTGGSDPLAQVALLFPSLQSAEDYCRRQALRYRVRRI